MNLHKSEIYIGGRYRLKYYFIRVCTYMGFPGGSVVRTSLLIQEIQETRVQSLGQENPLAKENGNPFQYSCLGNARERGTRWATVPGVTKSWTRLSD